MTTANTGTTNLIGTLGIELTGLPADVVLANASGIAPDGNPYISINSARGVLAPGQSVTLPGLFKNPKWLLVEYGVFGSDRDANG